MDKKKAIETIRNKYFKEYKFKHKTDDKIKFFESLLQIAKDNNLRSYELCIQGYLALLKNDYELAIKYLMKSLEIDKTLDFSWNALGHVYLEQKHYDKAIEAYEKAIKINEYFTVAWNNLGVIYSEQNQDEKAMRCFEKATKIDENFAHHFRNLGLMYLKTERFLEAKKAFEKALDLFLQEKDEYYISITKNIIQQTENLIKAQAELEKTTEDPAAQVITNTMKKGIEKEASKNKEDLLKFIKEKSSAIKEEEIYFEVLRRWNSYTPIIADNFHISKGGGYFLKVKGKGIVIDPGFNFIDNFKGSGHAFGEIDAVLISHAHNDHNADLERIITLLFEYNNEIKGIADVSKEGTIRAEIAQVKNKAPENVNEEEIEKEFLKSNRRKVIELYMTKSTFKKYSGMFELFSTSDYVIHMIEKGDKKEVYGVKIDVIGAEHGDIISDRDAVGFIIGIDDSDLIYTGDTGWTKEIEEEYKKIAGNYKSKIFKLLVAHLGGFKDNERNYMIEEERENSFYPDHLGRLGLAKINQILEPNMCFISEFGEEFKSLRIEIADIYNEVFKGKIAFFPADIGLKLDLKQKKINAIIELNAGKTDYKEGPVEPKEVKCRLLRKDYSLHYYHDNKQFDVCNLVEILGDKFEKSIK